MPRRCDQGICDPKLRQRSETRVLAPGIQVSSLSTDFGSCPSPGNPGFRPRNPDSLLERQLRKSGNPGEIRFPAAKAGSPEITQLRNFHPWTKTGNPGAKPGFAAVAELRKFELAEENRESPLQTRFCSAPATSEVAPAGEIAVLSTETRFTAGCPTSGCKSPGHSVAVGESGGE